MIYTAPTTVAKFMLNPNFARWIIGPLRSGKTAGIIMDLTRHMREQEPDAQGVRPTRFAVVRNTLQQLRQTVLPDIMTWLGPVAQFKFTDSTIHFNFPLDDGTRVKSEWLLIPLDSPEDQKRLLSLQLTGAWLAEFRELPYQVCAAVMGRVGRYPSPAVVKPTWQGIVGESNPFSEGSEWFEHLVMDLPDGWSFFKQPGGLSPEAENRENLPANYYERLSGGHSDEWKKVHIDGLYGDDLSGQAVFRASFNPLIHCSRSTLTVNPHRPVMVALDFGRTPTALVCQVDTIGRLIVFQEITSVDMGLAKFIQSLLTPALQGERYGGRRVFVVADPAGNIKSQDTENSLFDVLRNNGYVAFPAPTNDISRRLTAVEQLLIGRRGDQPQALLIDAQHCPMLVKALLHNYKYKRRVDGSTEDKPEKLHPWSDLADCLQYASLGAQIDATGKIMAKFTTKQNVRPRIPASAWT